MEVKWTKDGTPWSPPADNPKIYFSNNKRKIVFESITPEDNGNYMCVANNLFKTSATTDLIFDSTGNLIAYKISRHFQKVHFKTFKDRNACIFLMKVDILSIFPFD
jgi:3-polyprenyl-4-hydroxybenzoate decarboxylase